MTATSVIALRDVRKVFQTDAIETYALSDVHLDIRKGGFVCITGPSGCGKTTPLSILGLLDTPSAGSPARDDTRHLEPVAYRLRAAATWLAAG